MKNVSTLKISFSIIVFALLSLTIDTAHLDSVSPLRPTDDILRSKAAFAVVDEAIARGLNLHILSESDYLKIRGPVLLDPLTDIHSQLREQFRRIVNTVDFGASSDTGSANQSPSINRGDKPILHKKAVEIIRDFIAQEHISVIIMSDAPIGIGEIAAIRGLQGEVPYTYEIINSAAVSVPLKNFAALIKRHFIAEIWPDSEGNLALVDSIPQIGANNVHNAPTGAPSGLGVTGKGVLVGVVDDGIRNTHPAITTNRIKDIRSALHVNRHITTHGTNVAGIIGAVQHANSSINGVAPEVQFLDAQKGWTILQNEYSDATDALNWAKDKGADVINLSKNWDAWIYGRIGNDPMSKVIDEIVEDHRIIVVNAADNEAQRRAIGVFDPNQVTRTSNPFEHLFSGGTTTTIQVTLVWEPPSRYDLDLVLLVYDPNTQSFIEVAAARHHAVSAGPLTTAVLAGPLTAVVTADVLPAVGLPWSGSTVHGGIRVYEQIRYNVPSPVQPNTIYKVRVEGHNVSGLGTQAYEVWLKGNVGQSEPTFFSPDKEKTVGAPGYSEKVITVGAVKRNNDIADYSSRGPSDTGVIKPEVVAPGTILPIEPISSTLPTKGTSNAAPHVAGVAALILDAVGKNSNGEWNFSPAEVKSAIVRGAERGIGTIPNTPRPDNSHGAGLVKADNIIFGGTVAAGQKLLFRITPRLTESSFSSGYLNAEHDLAVAISSAANVSPLDLQLLHQSGRSPVQVPSQGPNYKKIILALDPGFASSGEFLYLNISHNGKGYPIRFTGASTHPIRRNLDVNGDHVVDVKDLVAVADVLVAAKKLTVSHTDSHYDVDKDVDADNDVDLDDMLAIANEIPGAAPAPSAYPSGIETIQQWLAETKRMGNIDSDFLQSIEVLEQLLDLLTPIIPMETALLANYPNPFNPETWIPYQLAKRADVTLTIHAVDGKLVRALDLGHQRPGMYQSRARAAYWDGRNAVGEPVASGVYFYTLTAGEFTATRKMLIRK